MRWLFDEKSIPQRHQQKDGKKTNAMDSILRSLANRETRRPGFGVRLFVQACVLTGSDYSPSRLNGVGSVTAFKLLRDNAHRKHEERFRHTLSSLSKKKTGKVDMKDYEENLAQSEAVFYHHPVVHCADKSIVTLTAFRESNADDKTDFHPNLERFGDDLTFLGDLGQKKARGISEIIPDAKLDSPLAGQEIIIKPKKRKRSLPPSQKAESANEQIRGKRQSSELTDIAKLMNPYKKKAKDEVPRQVFAKVDKTKTETKNKSASYDFSQFAHQAEEPRIFGLKAYRKPREDVRFVKAKFDKDGRRMSSGIRERLSDLKSRNADMAARAAERTEWTSSAKASQHGLSSCSRDSANRSSADSGSSAKRNTKKFNLLQHTLSTFGSRKHRRKSWSSEHDDGDFDQPLDLTSDSSNHAFEKQREEMRNAKISQSFGTENNTTSKPPHEVSSSFLESASHLQRSSSRQDIFDEADDDGSSVEQILPREAQVQHPRSRKTSSYFDSGRAGKELQSDPDTFFENVADDDQSVGGVPRVSLLSSESSKYWSNNKSSPHPKSRDTFEDVELNTARNSFTPSSNFDCKPPASEGSSSVVAIDVDNFDDVGKSRHPARRITLDSPPPKERLEDSFTPKESSPGGDSVLSEAGEAPFHSIFAKRTSSPSSFDSRPSSSRSGSKPWRWSYRQQSPQTSLYDHFSKSSSTPASKGPSAPRKALKRTKLDGQITHHFTYKKANEDNEWLE